MSVLLRVMFQARGAQVDAELTSFPAETLSERGTEPAEGKRHTWTPPLNSFGVSKPESK